jgi:two-component system cell cycle response regulator
MSNTPRLLDQLVSLTAIRDVELLEFSLLKALNEVLRPEELSLFKLDKQDRPRYLIRYEPGGHYRVATGTVELPEAVLSAVPTVRRTRAPHVSRQSDGRFLGIYPVLELKTFDTYLMVQSEHTASRLRTRLTQGLLQVYQNFCTLLDEAQRDQLTGLPNRKTFSECIHKLCGFFAQDDRAPGSRERRQHFPASDPPIFWLAMIDIDRFKRINDTYGHLYGDEVLLLIAQIMQRCFREDDFLFRFGGEEFVVITHGSDREGARAAFERFRETIANHEFPQVGQVTVSLGAVQIPPDAVAPTLLDQADQALYHAKNHGRNRVCFYEDLLESGEVQPQSIRTGSIDFF